MNKYYKLKKKRRSGTVFIARMIVQVWNISRNQWDDRNRCLHTIQEASEHQDGPKLAIKIANQFNQGHNDLPTLMIIYFTKENDLILFKLQEITLLKVILLPYGIYTRIDTSLIQLQDSCGNTYLRSNLDLC